MHLVHPMMIMEYLACGDLLGYLRKSRGIHDKYHLGQGSVPELEIYDLVLFAKQIAAGMVFLGSRGVSKHLTEIKLQQNSTGYKSLSIYSLTSKFSMVLSGRLTESETFCCCATVP